MKRDLFVGPEEGREFAKNGKPPRNTGQLIARAIDEGLLPDDYERIAAKDELIAVQLKLYYEGKCDKDVFDEAVKCIYANRIMHLVVNGVPKTQKLF